MGILVAATACCQQSVSPDSFDPQKTDVRGGPVIATTSLATSEWRYLVFGDSLAFGLFADQGYVERYRQYLREDLGGSVKLKNESHMIVRLGFCPGLLRFHAPAGHSYSALGRLIGRLHVLPPVCAVGLTTRDMLKAITTNTKIRSAIAKAQVITFDIGANDLRIARRKFVAGVCGGPDNQECLRTTVMEFKRNWDGIVAVLVSLAGNKAVIRTFDIYNPHVRRDLRTGNLEVFQPYLDQVNQHISNSARANGLAVAHVWGAFNGTSGKEDPRSKNFLAFDRVHPNDRGHRVIADLLRDLGYAPLR